MGEIALTVSKGGFPPNLLKLPDLDKTTARLVFKVTVIEPVVVIKLGSFLGTVGPILTQSLPHGGPYGLSDLTAFSPKCDHRCRFYTRWNGVTCELLRK